MDVSGNVEVRLELSWLWLKFTVTNTAFFSHTHTMKWVGWVTRQEYIDATDCSSHTSAKLDWLFFFSEIARENPSWVYLDFRTQHKEDAIHFQKLLDAWEECEPVECEPVLDSSDSSWTEVNAHDGWTVVQDS